MDVSTDYLKTFVAVSDCKSFSLPLHESTNRKRGIAFKFAKLEEQGTDSTHRSTYTES
jgi:hypothetical protein